MRGIVREIQVKSPHILPCCPHEGRWGKTLIGAVQDLTCMCACPLHKFDEM